MMEFHQPIGELLVGPFTTLTASQDAVNAVYDAYHAHYDPGTTRIEVMFDLRKDGLVGLGKVYTRDVQPGDAAATSSDDAAQ